VKNTGCSEKFQLVSEAFSDQVGEQTLYLTNVRTGSTLLKVDDRSEGMAHLSKNYFYPLTETKIKTTTLDQFAGDQALLPDAIKVDVQGAEFKVLKGAQAKALKNCLCLDFEVGLVRLYHDQAPFSEVFDFLESQGFSMFDVRVSRSFVGKDGDPHHYLQIEKGSFEYQGLSARSWELDCVFFKKASIVLESRNREQVIKLVSLYCAYNFYGEAMDLIERAQVSGVLATEEAKSLLVSVRGLLKINTATNRWNFLTRRVREFFNTRRDKYWARFVWMDYPSS
jgi:FkbM family methyltransferase